MSSLIIMTMGTLGDHLPYIALGRRLHSRGHRVRMAVSASMTKWVTDAGLEAIPCGQPLGETEARRASQDWDHWKYVDSDSSTAPIALWQDFLARDIPLSFAQLLDESVAADLFICAYQRQNLGALLSQKTGVAWLATSVMPALHCGELLNPLFNRAEVSQSLDQSLHDIAHTLGLQAGLQKSPPLHALLASSPHFSQVDAANAGYQQTGFWFYDNPQQQTEMDSALMDFLNRFPEPLILSFSSLAVQDARAVLSLHVRAAEQLGCGLIVQRGWANFSADLLPEDCLSDAVFFTDFVPQDALFSKAAAVIHHGGIGTIARALRHDCPMLVEPYGNDQFFNAKQVLIHQIGAAAHPHKITVEGLIRLLTQKVFTAHCRHNVKQLGEKIRAENGLEQACENIEQVLHHVHQARINKKTAL